LPRVSQDLNKRQYYGRGLPHNGQLIWSLPAQQALNFVRACDFSPFLSPWGHPQTRKGNLEIQIVKATPTGLPAGSAPGTVGWLESCGLVIACGDEWISVTKVKVQDKFMNAAEILRVGDHMEIANPLEPPDPRKDPHSGVAPFPLSRSMRT
jgi:methionyl-tRNA formyltransferase